MEVKHKYSLKYLQEVAKERGGKVLSDRYYGVKIKLKWQCENEHIWTTTPALILKGSWCPSCARGNKTQPKSLYGSSVTQLEYAKYIRYLQEIQQFGSWATTDRIEAKQFEKYLQKKEISYNKEMVRSLYVFELNEKIVM